MGASLLLLIIFALSGAPAPESAASRTPTAARDETPGYRIGPEDVLQVSVWGNDAVSRTVPVRPDGKISLPLLNDVHAAGSTPEQLAGVLAQAAVKYIADPDVTVIVKEIHSRRVFVLGNVTSPGMISLSGELNVLQLIAVVGGLLEYADKENIVIIRSESGQEKRLKFNYNDVVKGKNVKQNILLQPGDTVVVR